MNETPTQSPDQGPEHNPDGLTPEQYGAPEWRLLTKEEVRRNVALNAGPSREIESWKDGRFWEPGYCGAAKEITYRRRVAPEPTQTPAPQIIGYVEKDNGIRGPGFAKWQEPVYGEPEPTAEQRIAELEREKRIADGIIAEIEKLFPCGETELDEVVAFELNRLRARIAELERTRDGTVPYEEFAQLRAANAQLERERDEARADADKTRRDYENASAAHQGSWTTINDLRAQLAASEKDRKALEEAAQGLGLATQQAFWMAESEAERADCIEEMRTSALTWQTRAGKFSKALARFDALKEGK